MEMEFEEKSKVDSKALHAQFTESMVVETFRHIYFMQYNFKILLEKGHGMIDYLKEIAVKSQQENIFLDKMEQYLSGVNPQEQELPASVLLHDADKYYGLLVYNPLTRKKETYSRVREESILRISNIMNKLGKKDLREAFVSFLSQKDRAGEELAKEFFGDDTKFKTLSPGELGKPHYTINDHHADYYTTGGLGAHLDVPPIFYLMFVADVMSRSYENPRESKSDLLKYLETQELKKFSQHKIFGNCEGVVLRMFEFLEERLQEAGISRLSDIKGRMETKYMSEYYEQDQFPMLRKSGAIRDLGKEYALKHESFEDLIAVFVDSESPDEAAKKLSGHDEFIKNVGSKLVEAERTIYSLFASFEKYLAKLNPSLLTELDSFCGRGAELPYYHRRKDPAAMAPHNFEDVGQFCPPMGIGRTAVGYISAMDGGNPDPDGEMATQSAMEDVLPLEHRTETGWTDKFDEVPSSGRGGR